MIASSPNVLARPRLVSAHGRPLFGSRNFGGWLRRRNQRENRQWTNYGSDSQVHEGNQI